MHLRSYKNFCYKLVAHHLEMTEEEKDLDELVNRGVKTS